MRTLLAAAAAGCFLVSCQNSTPETPVTNGAVVEKRVTRESALGSPSTEKLGNLVDKYYALKDAFVKSDSVAAPKEAEQVDVALNAFQSGLAGTTPPAGVTAHADSMKTALQLLTAPAAAKMPLEQQRAAFEQVSDHLTALLRSAQWKGGAYQQFCPMAFNDKGAHWLSNSDEIQNPYFGDRMLECGEVTDSL